MPPQNTSSTWISPKVKPWGVTRCINISGCEELWHASVLRGGYSSRHYHRDKMNKFYVVSGTLLVNIYDDPAEEPSATILLASGTSYGVPSEVWHSFLAVQDVEMIEHYTANPGRETHPDDIVRHAVYSVGGVQ